jgi:RNA polymerase sigma-70 factor (ECF subfamily)
MTARLQGRLEAPPSRGGCDQRKAAARDGELRGDGEVVDAVLAGDEAAFLSLAKRWHGSMVRVARCYAPSDAVAEEVARSAWRPVLEGLASWRARASLAPYIVGVVMGRARCRASLEHADPAPPQGAPREIDPVPDDDGLRSVDLPASAGGLRDPGGSSPERLGSLDARAALLAAVDGLPPVQRLVFTVRDIVGCRPDEASGVLGLSEVEQRAILHRARTRLRAAMQSHLSSSGEVARSAPGEPR